MKKWEKLAIELKYNGKTYQQIAIELSKLADFKVSSVTLAHAFAVDGRLNVDYLLYEAKQNNWNEEHSRQEHKRLSAATADVRKQILREALKHGDYRLALDVVKDIDDRAGNVVVRKVENKEVKQPIQTYDEYVAECRRLGVSPDTGLPSSAEKILQN
jgi:hypothetical protein